MMLNVDMSLIKNLTRVDSSGRVRGCTYSTCKAVDSTTIKTGYWVKQFAADNKLFLQEFGKAFQKMISKGYTKLKAVDSSPVFG